MIYPIIGYGHPTLRKIAKPVEKDYPDLKQLVADMYETMYAADGCGLAAPQIDLSLRLVVIGYPIYDDKTDTYSDETIEHTLINPVILESKGQKKMFNEGCLSIPGIHEDVLRPETIVLRYYDVDFVEHTEEISGMFARVAQHEIDHLEGKVFTDRLSSLRKTLLKRRLCDVAAGNVRTSYKMKPVRK